MLATILNLFGWTMLDATVHLLNVFPLVRAVHHLSIITALIARMSLWSVVSTNEQKGYKHSSLFIEFSLPHSNGPYATLAACNTGDYDYMSLIIKWFSFLFAEITGDDSDRSSVTIGVSVTFAVFFIIILCIILIAFFCCLFEKKSTSQHSTSQQEQSQVSEGKIKAIVIIEQD